MLYRPHSLCTVCVRNAFGCFACSFSRLVLFTVHCFCIPFSMPKSFCMQVVNIQNGLFLNHIHRQYLFNSGAWQGHNYRHWQSSHTCRREGCGEDANNIIIKRSIELLFEVQDLLQIFLCESQSSHQLSMATYRELELTPASKPPS